MLDLSATRQQDRLTVDCAQKLSSCTICRDKLHCGDKIIPPAEPLPQLFWVCRWHCTLRDSHASAATCPKICGQPARSLGNSKRFISTFVAGILLIVLVYVDQLVVIWLQHEHTQKTLSPHLLLTSPIKRRSQRNAVCSAYLRHCLDTRFIFHQEAAHIEIQTTDMKNKNIEAVSIYSRHVYP
ncbi:hypothetical protein [Aeromonas hydrophila]|uniref:hypothetical protein n=1 Tax=Aeromonas hydrophila TaxID=644 RepID=UPI000B03749C|nr:hypothetical protein [Aeromonas hydrophila]